MTLQLAFNIFVTLLTFFSWFIWKADHLPNMCYKMAMFISWVSGLILIAQHFGFIIKI